MKDNENLQSSTLLLTNEELLNSELENDPRFYEEVTTGKNNLVNYNKETENKAYLFQYCWYNTEKDMIECSFCQCAKPPMRRTELFQHIRNVHKNMIQENEFNPEQIEDCEQQTCKSLYGGNYQQLWCKECILNPPKGLVDFNCELIRICNY